MVYSKHPFFQHCLTQYACPMLSVNTQQSQFIGCHKSAPSYPAMKMSNIDKIPAPAVLKHRPGLLKVLNENIGPVWKERIGIPILGILFEFELSSNSHQLVLVSHMLIREI
jgi:hypothetical protein